MIDWFYISFADKSGFLGGCYVCVTERDPAVEALMMLDAAKARGDGTTLDQAQLDVMHAIRRAHELGINPGGSARVARVLGRYMLSVPDDMRERLLTREEVERT